ncbi:uncharacterized endoplasmic reticulum membrane protein C16E8.02-like [Punica granatum]|uniref:Uncharacterized endoplasmic reticulum membrane protein C16E8.02-like n=2 Tax=Punica granatum TaxID=22663 RepID=A0A6P8EIT2_PUNGR|nr:uncharacterized endoplasmic reticulum membrane protein C16E8.02-like [Punica granatum]PKI63273.1 hypothetical protein CRG98_016458 [Punica granatum]
MARKGLFDLERHFAFYGAYHSNKVNILIHTLFVWPIFFTSLVLFYFTPSVCELIGTEPQCFLARRGLFLNFGFFFALIYAVAYVLMDVKAGSLAALLCMACWVTASSLARTLGFSLAWKVVLAAQLFCWTGQFIGHGVFEKRAPALLDNLAQAFLMAPFFVLLEVLQIVFKYEPYPGFHVSVNQKIEAEIKEWQEKQQKKMS